MNKAQLLARLEKRWTAFKESFASLTEEEMTRSDTAGEWSLKDVLGHVTTWEEEALKYLPIILADKRPPRYQDQYGGLDAFNAQMVEKKRALSLHEIRRQLDETHQRLLDYLQGVPQEHFLNENRFRRRLRMDTYSHYPIHAKAIRDAYGSKEGE